ncbi:MAG: hypothetical protein KA731_00385 [Candidatus Moranbacteria bacterium]|nr:hypothetical protein [Candidatus Moranbacteria bacterium]MBP6033875.1 hypothetical protein [Candidatus Moranbacteria bacterium]MBP7695667.1 hypothetical protein [Candidatus Moranbacteria bacterium]
MAAQQLPQGCIDAVRFMACGGQGIAPECSRARFYRLEDYQERLAARQIDASDCPVVDRYFDIVISQPENHRRLAALLGFAHGLCLTDRTLPQDFPFWWQALSALGVTGWEADARQTAFQFRFLERGYYLSDVTDVRLCIRREAYRFDPTDTAIMENLSCFETQYV